MASEILVGVDGSEGSREALRWAAQFASLTGRRVRAVRAWRYPSAAPVDFFGTTPLGSPRAVDRAIEDDLHGILVRELGEAGARAGVSALRGDSAGALIAAARRSDAFLLVVGSRGLGGFRGLLLGSVGRTVVEHAADPVAVVRRFVEPRPGALLVVGVDGSPGSAAAVVWVTSVAADLHGEVHAVHALNPYQRPGSATWDERRREARRELQTWTAPLREGGIRHRADIEIGDAREVLMATAEREQPLAVVVASRGGGLARVLLGSVPSFLAQRLPGVLVVVPVPSEDASPLHAEGTEPTPRVS